MQNRIFMLIIIIITSCQVSPNQQPQKCQDRVDHKPSRKKLQKAYVVYSLNTARQKIKTHKYEVAKAYLNHIHDMLPKNPKLQKDYNELCTILPNHTVPVRGCIEYVDIDEEILQHDVNEFYDQGVQYFKKKSYKKAQEQFKKILEILKYAPSQFNIQPSKKQVTLMIEKIKKR
ncbi:hypothetical protein [Candidatus Uabimicrobium sp. HlEnr_7]|uniref:hypothetical protein n=1 Tax=Candidatus Uabimicrobium helgolandensis TaxID=3095367 RepID=UPI003558BF7C